jgi:hypothetical protein
MKSIYVVNVVQKYNLSKLLMSLILISFYESTTQQYKIFNLPYT